MGKMTEQAQQKAKAWLQKNGFDEKGYTYVLIGIDSYPIKDELKAAGWVYNPILRWHKSDPGEYPHNVRCYHWSCLYELMAWGDFVPFPDAQKLVDETIAEAMPALPAEYLGEVGDKFHSISCSLVRKGYFQGKWGLTTILTFVDEEDHTLTWFTSTNVTLEVGSKCKLSGTIKEQKEYHGKKSVTVTRCRIS